MVVSAGRSPDDLVVMENHDEAYAAWSSRKISQKTLLHIDAHIDFCWISDDPRSILDASCLPELYRKAHARPSWNFTARRQHELISIANFIYPAVREGMVREFYWVVPDPVWDSLRQRRLLRRLFRNLRSTYQQGVGPVHEYSGRMETTLLGVRTVVTTLRELPPIPEEVLLDIDTDFLINRQLEGEPLYFRAGAASPWISPGEVADTLCSKQIRPLITTIAYSVEGGFTPLEYKYLGDELAALLAGRRPFLPAAAAAYRRSLQSRRQGRLEEARAALRDALSQDPSYATLYNSAALRLFHQGKFAACRTECLFMLEVCGSDSAYRLLLADAERALGRTAEATEAYDRVLAAHPQHAGACLGKGMLALREKEYHVAYRWLGEAAAGGKGGAHAQYLYGIAAQRLGDRRQALRSIQQSLLCGYRRPEAFFILAMLHARAGNFLRAREKFCQGLMRICTS